MKRALLAIAAVLALTSATYITSDPTHGANGTGYCDTCIVTYRGDGLTSTYFTGDLNLTRRKYVRFVSLTINGNVSLDSASSNVILDSVRVNGNISFAGDSSRFSNSTQVGNHFWLQTYRGNHAVADTVAPEFWVENDTISNARLILTPGYQELAGWALRGVKNGYFSAVDCSLYCAPGKQAPAFKAYMSRANTFTDVGWHIKNEDSFDNQESGYWCLRDLSSWNTFLRDTVWMTGSGYTNIGLNHAGNCNSPESYCNKQMRNSYTQCWFINFTNNARSRTVYQCNSEGDQFKNCVFASRGGFDMRAGGTARTYQSGKTVFRHNTFISYAGPAFLMTEPSATLDNLIFVDNALWTRASPYPDWPADVHDTKDNAPLRFDAGSLGTIDSMDYNLYGWQQPDQKAIYIADPNAGARRSNPGSGDILYTAYGLEQHGWTGSPAFTDSTPTFKFNPQPASGSYALGGRWRDNFVGFKAATDSVPDSTASITVAYNNTLVYLSCMIPRDDHGVVAYRLYRSSTPTSSIAAQTLMQTGDVSVGQGVSITIPIGQHQQGVQWYYYIRFEDTIGQLGPQTQASVKVSSGHNWWWSDF